MNVIEGILAVICGLAVAIFIMWLIHESLVDVVADGIERERERRNREHSRNKLT